MKWQLVDEIKPKNGGCLVFESNYITLAFYVASSNKFIDSDYIELNPTHWMALPEKPNK